MNDEIKDILNEVLDVLYNNAMENTRNQKQADKLAVRIEKILNN